MKSLVQLAQEKSLPSHQYMDERTLQWIKDNPPDISKVSSQSNISFIKEDADIIKSFIPNPQWFSEPKTIDSIHGIRHIIRCLIYGFILAKRLSVSDKPLLELLVATSLHDTRRQNDKKEG
ncbi:hypothetical protein COY23_01395 [bacterium (Candidatus Torokbacteria) CG_4_10_14_0_2_um_filter_35_8]|nr:MAG: hypothetical protein COY23_01395 [bacterium (Candidatus Torokbacteria) CG_4_10_14_0_2_um_filter_35_8]